MLEEPNMSIILDMLDKDEYKNHMRRRVPDAIEASATEHTGRTTPRKDQKTAQARKD